LLEELEEPPFEPGPQEFIEAIEAATAALERERQTRYVKDGKLYGKLAILDALPEEFVVIGDIHGDLHTLISILKDIDYKRLLSNPHNKLLFLGDYVDRGSNSVGVLYTVCCLKQKFPDSVLLMRGNHEAPLEFPFFSHNLPNELTRRYGSNRGKLIYDDKIIPFFQMLILIVLIRGQLLIVHGGLPTDKELLAKVHSEKKLEVLSRQQFFNNVLIEEILWNDPVEHLPRGVEWEYSRRGYGKHFGGTVSKKWLKATESKIILRGHEPCAGFKVNHEGAVLTLFSCHEAYPGFNAAYLKVSQSQLESISHPDQLLSYVKKIS
jgi:protein phosphatase